MSPANKMRAILDLDLGTDDAMALLVFLDAEKRGLIKIEAIVCSMGNASLNNVCRNVVRFLEILQRTDIPIYKGALNPIIPAKEPIEQFHGSDGFGDIEHETEPDLSIIREEPAAVAIHNLVLNNPNEISLICVGPLTNAALAIILHENFASNIKDMYIMGGNLYGVGNVSQTAEFNFYMDPESAYVVLDRVEKPITMLAWEPCDETPVTLDWRFNVLGKSEAPVMKLLTRAEKSLYKNFSLDDPWNACDGLLAVCMFYPEAILKQRKINASVELHGNSTRGQMIVKRFREQERYNVNAIEKINYDVVKNAFLEIVGRL